MDEPPEDILAGYEPDGSGAFRRPEWSFHGKRRALRINLLVAWTTTSRTVRKLAQGVGKPAAQAEMEVIERLARTVETHFDLRWKGDDSDDPDIPPPGMR